MILLGDAYIVSPLHMPMYFPCCDGGLFLPCPPERPLSLLECRLTFVPANSGTPYVLFSAKVMLKFSVNFSMILLKIGHMGYLRLMHGPGYLST